MEYRMYIKTEFSTPDKKRSTIHPDVSHATLRQPSINFYVISYLIFCLTMVCSHSHPCGPPGQKV